MFHLDQQSRGGVNSDLAFWNNIAAAGNYNGFRLLDIRDPENTKVLTTVTCRGAQGDVSFYKARQRLLLFVSVDTPQDIEGPPPGAKDCNSQDSSDLVPTSFEGIRIWDVTDPTQPKFVKGVRTRCGSHTHTTIPDHDEQRALIYVSSYPLAATGLGPRCGPPNNDPDPRATRAPHGKISIVEVPDANPAQAQLLKEQSLHLDSDAVPDHEPEPGHDDAPLPTVVGCHDITVLFQANQSPEGNPPPKPQLAAAACLTEGQIWDISDPANPKTLDDPGHVHFDNSSIEFWHSAAWTYDGRTVVFGDEHGGGSAPGCGTQVDPTGNAWFYRNRWPLAPQLLGRYHVPRQQLVLPQECSIHNFNVVPVNDNKAYIGVSSAYKAGTTVFDFSLAKSAPPCTLPAASCPVLGQEIGFYDAQVGGEADTWSTYWYNDYIWANDGLGRPTPGQTDSRGLDVFKILLPDENGKQLRARKFHHLNPQTQEVFTAQGG